MHQPLSLDEMTGRQYRIVLEESWYHERPEVRQPDRRWYERILCRGGAWIALYWEEGGVILQLYTPRVKNAREIYRRLEREPLFQTDFLKNAIHKEKLELLEGEAVLYFPLELVHIVAEKAGARRRRRLSPEARAKLALLGQATQFPPRFHGVESEKTAQEGHDFLKPRVMVRGG